jgi:hypothetical protein
MGIVSSIVEQSAEAVPFRGSEDQSTRHVQQFYARLLVHSKVLGSRQDLALAHRPDHRDSPETTIAPRRTPPAKGWIESDGSGLAAAKKATQNVPPKVRIRMAIVDRQTGACNAASPAEVSLISDRWLVARLSIQP